MWGMFEKTTLSMRSQPCLGLPRRSFDTPEHSAGVTPATALLRVGSRIVSRCRDGSLDAEYALFARNETLLRSSSSSCREVGYLTSAGDALARLARVGVTLELARVAADAISHDVRRSYARSQCVCALVERLGENELFDSPLYEAGVYEGGWLDLGALASDLRVSRATVALK